jgi:hypothetical protein
MEGLPVPGAHVRLDTSPVHLRADARGCFEIPVEEGADRLNLSVWAPGFRVRDLAVSARDASAIRVRLHRSLDTASLELRVLTPAGRLATGAAYRILRLERPTLPVPEHLEAILDYQDKLRGLDVGVLPEDGVLRWTLAPGAYRVVLFHPEGYEDLRVDLGARGRAGDVVLQPGLTLQAAVSVDCDGSCGKRTHKIFARVQQSECAWGATVHRLGPGRIRVTGVPLLSGDLIISTEGHPPLLRAFRPSDGEGGFLDFGRLRIEPGRRIRGTVRYADGAPLRDAVLRVYQRVGSQAHALVEDGQFELTGVAADVRELKVQLLRGGELALDSPVDFARSEWDIVVRRPE